jgi:hypothetical protein
LFFVFDLFLSVFINVHTRSVLISASLRLLQRGGGDDAADWNPSPLPRRLGCRRAIAR